MDAAYIRVLSSGKWREITKPLGKLVVNIADCYPDPETAPFPENPVGVLAEILNNKKIRVGTYPITGIGSNNLFSPTTEKILRAVLDELGKGYNLSAPIEIVPVIVDPPSSTSLFTRLNNGDFDITDLNGALGAKALGQRRRQIARFTCTALASGQFLQVLENSPYQTFDDVVADPNAKLCAGSLSIQLARAYFPGHEVTFSTGDDIEECSQGVLSIRRSFLGCRRRKSLCEHFDYCSRLITKSRASRCKSAVGIWLKGMFIKTSKVKLLAHRAGRPGA
jgi:hypothetical protein